MLRVFNANFQNVYEKKEQVGGINIFNTTYRFLVFVKKEKGEQDY